MECISNSSIVLVFVSGGDLCVGGTIKERARFFRVGQLNLYHPTLFIRRLVNKVRVTLKILVDFGDLTRNRKVNIRSSLHGFHGTK